jgi:hypothetical protein
MTKCQAVAMLLEAKPQTSLYGGGCFVGIAIGIEGKNSITKNN